MRKPLAIAMPLILISAALFAAEGAGQPAPQHPDLVEPGTLIKREEIIVPLPEGKKLKITYQTKVERVVAPAETVKAKVEVLGNKGLEVLEEEGIDALRGPKKVRVTNEKGKLLWEREFSEGLEVEAWYSKENDGVAVIERGQEGYEKYGRGYLGQKLHLFDLQGKKIFERAVKKDDPETSFGPLKGTVWVGDQLERLRGGVVFEKGEGEKLEIRADGKSLIFVTPPFDVGGEYKILDISRNVLFKADLAPRGEAIYYEKKEIVILKNRIDKEKTKIQIYSTKMPDPIFEGVFPIGKGYWDFDIKNGFVLAKGFRGFLQTGKNLSIPAYQNILVYGMEHGTLIHDASFPHGGVYLVDVEVLK